MLQGEAKQVIFLFPAHGTYQGPTVCASQGKAVGTPPAFSSRGVPRARALRQAVLSLRLPSGLSLLPNHRTIPCTQQNQSPFYRFTYLFISVFIMLADIEHLLCTVLCLQDKQLRARTARDGCRGVPGGPSKKSGRGSQKSGFIQAEF